jgi:predicted permease
MGNITSKLIFYVALLFIMMVPGIIMKKCRFATDGFGKGLSNLVLYIAQPALVFLAYVQPFDAVVLKNSLAVLVISILMHSIFAVSAILVFRKAEDSARRMLRLATVFSNAAFMGIPLIAAVLGSEATIYATVYNITFNLFLWSLGVYFCTANRDMDKDGDIDASHERVTMIFKSLGKAFIHPVTLAAFVGIIFFLLPIDTYVPEIATEALTMLKNLVAPLSMVVIGLRLSEISFKGFFRDVYMYLFIALRHFVLPAVTVLLIFLIRLVGIEISDTVSTVLVIMSATPAASSATMFAEKFDCDSAYASKLVAFSTILSILSMPLMVMFSDLF